ncbi:MAG: hypothetical protein MUE69_19730 [Myxococcota bacterium]|nr:hypothetical protein [Myxococcota bacterium]
MLLVTSLGRQASAQTAADVDLRWTRAEGVEGCWGQPEVEDAVRAQLGRDPFGRGAPRVLEAQVSAVPGGVELRVVERTADGEVVGRRALRATSCDELGPASALVVAVVIDPRGVLATEPAPDPDVEPEPAPEPPSEPETAPRPEPAPSPTALEAFVALGLRATGLPDPSARVATGLGWSPARHVTLRLELAFSPDAKDADVGAGSVDLDLGVCATSEGALVLGGCVRGGASLVHAYPRGLEPVEPGVRVHGRLGLSALLGVRHRRFFAELEPLATWMPPRTRYRVIESGRVLWRSPTIELAVQVRVGARFGR